MRSRTPTRNDLIAFFCPCCLYSGEEDPHPSSLLSQKSPPSGAVPFLDEMCFQHAPFFEQWSFSPPQGTATAFARDPRTA